MAKGDATKVQNRVNYAAQSGAAGNANVGNELNTQLHGAIDPLTGQPSGGKIQQQADRSSDVYSRYTDAANSGMVDQGSIDNLRGMLGGSAPNVTGSSAYSGLAGLGANGVDTSSLTGLNKGYADVGANPINATNRGAINNSISGLSNIGQTGGWDPNDTSTIRGVASKYLDLAGNTGYENFATTGGFNPSDEANFRARSNSVIPSYYSQEQAGLDRSANLSSGNPYAVNAARLRLGQQGSQAASDASQGTEVNLRNMINQNKLAGLAGMDQTKLAALSGAGSTTQNLGQALAASKLYGLTGAASAATSAQNLENSTRLGALGGQSANTSGALGLDLQGRLAGLTGQAGLDVTNANLGLAQRGQDIGINQYTNNAIQGGRQAGLTGLAGQSNLSDADLQNYYQMLMGNNNSNNQFNLGLVGAQLGQAGVPSTFQNVLGNIGRIGGGIAGGLTGISDFHNSFGG